MLPTSIYRITLFIFCIVFPIVLLSIVFQYKMKDKIVKLNYEQYADL